MQLFPLALLLLLGAAGHAYAEETSLGVQKVLEYGLLGVLFLGVLWFLKRRDAELTEERKARLEDVKMLAKVVEDHNTTSRAATQAQEGRNVATEAMARAQELTARALEQLGKDLGQLASTVHRNNEEMESTRKEAAALMERNWARFVQDTVTKLRLEVIDRLPRQDRGQ